MLLRNVYEFLQLCTELLERIPVLIVPLRGQQFLLLRLPRSGNEPTVVFYINCIFLCLVMCLFYEEVKKHKPDFSSKREKGY
jgi:hypothetical protein